VPGPRAPLKAVIFHEHGGLDRMSYTDVDEPRAPPGGVQIRVRATGLNHLDLWALAGIEGVKIPLPHIGGSDIAGEVSALGEGAQGFKVGDRVVVNPSKWCGACEFCKRGDENYCPEYQIIGEHIDGGMADFFACPRRNLLKIPGHFPWEDAAAAALVYQTAWRAVVSRGQVKAGEWVLVTGASGGVSTAAIQIAKMHGARVITTTSTDEKARRARENGADHVFNYKTQAYDKEVYKLTEKRGVDLIVDSTGDAGWKPNLRALARGGRLALYGATSGNNPAALINVLYWKHITVLGTTMGNVKEFEKVMGLVFERKLKPVIDSVRPLRLYEAAFEQMQKGAQYGKIVFVP
jgi:NADPH:quinone reductase-like Zn-dependent oxidoreductase